MGILNRLDTIESVYVHGTAGFASSPDVAGFGEVAAEIVYSGLLQQYDSYSGREATWYYELNGGIETHTAVSEQLQHVDGVMVGRVVCANPYWLAPVDQQFYNVNYL